MTSLTGIEIGPDYCVLVRARQRRTSVEIEAARVFQAEEWPADSPAQARLLDEARRDAGMPRRAAVVAWDRSGFAGGSSEAMLTRAGFAVETVLAPADALALLAWSRPAHPGRDAAAWLAINNHGAAMAVVHELDLLYAHEFEWRIKASEQRVQANLLRRYLYVAQLAPEMRRAMDVVSEQHNRRIELAVTCGNIPDLRSFTMPLIDELDLEFETLDSLEGLYAEQERVAELAQYAPLVRLAGAAAVHGRRESSVIVPPRWLAVAAGLVLVAGAAWWALSMLPGGEPEMPPQDARPVVSAQGRSGSTSPTSTGAPVEPPGESGAPAPASQATQPTTGVTRPPIEAAHPPDRDQVGPLPAVGGILIASDRRLAVIDGSVVGPGDRVGSRIVVRIETDAVVFREPSGREIRVPVRIRGGA